MSDFADELEREAAAVADGAQVCGAVGFDNPDYTCMRAEDHGEKTGVLVILVDRHAAKLDGTWTTW